MASGVCAHPTRGVDRPFKREMRAEAGSARALQTPPRAAAWGGQPAVRYLRALINPAEAVQTSASEWQRKLGGPAAVEGDDLPGEKARIVTGQENGEVAYVAGIAHTADRVQPFQGVPCLSRCRLGVEVGFAESGVDPPGGDGVASNVVGAEVNG